MDIKTMQKIVDDAPPKATSVLISKCGNYVLYGRGDQGDSSVMLDDLRTELAKHDTLDLEPADIPHGCIVLEK